MLMGFIGDVHGRVFHALAALLLWQAEHGRRLDLVIQVGDLGAYPDPSRMDAATRQYLAVDPAEADFARMFTADGPLADQLRRIREHLDSPVHFLRGNHEDFDWLDSLPVDAALGTARVDDFDLFRYVPDGTVLRRDGLRIGFLGGVEERSDRARIDSRAYSTMLALGLGEIDILVAHQGQYGTSIGYHGDVHGSRLMTNLIERTQPAYFLFGHAHKLIGPGRHGRTTYLGLDGLVPSRRWRPEVRGLQPGSLAVLDTETGDLTPIAEAWQSRFEADMFDVAEWCATFFGH